MKIIIILFSVFLLVSITISLTIKRHDKSKKHHHSYSKKKHHSKHKEHHKKKKHHSKKHKSKHSTKEQTKNVYVYNNHFHLDKLPPYKEIHSALPNLRYSNLVHSHIVNEPVIHRPYVHGIEAAIPSTPVGRINQVHSHYVPKVEWVNDNQVQPNIVTHHAPHHPVAALTATHTLVHPEIIPSVAHVNHYPHQDVATYHVRNQREADLVYDNLVAPNPHHRHAYVNNK